MPTSKFSDPFAPVTTKPVEVGGEEVNKVAVMVTDDDGTEHLAGILGKNYNLIKNEVADDVSHDIMSRSPFKWNPLKSFFNGKRYAAHYITADPVTSIVNGDEHPIHLGFMVRNSYDGSGLFGLEMFACNMKCVNQYISRNRFGYFQIYHVDSQSYLIEDAVKNVSIGAEKLLEIAPQIQSMRDEELTTQYLCEAKKNINIPNSKWGEVIDQLALEEVSKFGLYQALTFVGSHKMEGFNSLKVLNSISDFVLNGNHQE